MNTIMRVMFATALAITPVLFSAPAQAVQATLNHTWVASAASGGSDSNNCDRPTPCATFQGAYNNTAAAGEITCVDSADFGPTVDISQSITINCESAIGSSTQSGGNVVGYFLINTPAGAVVTLRGLDIDGLGQSGGGSDLIEFTGAGVLHIHKVKINSLHAGASGGIWFEPSGPASLDVSDSYIHDNGSSGSNPGITISPRSGVQANVSINQTVIENNYFGIVADGTMGGTIRATIGDSVISGNTEDGIAAISSGSTVWLLVDQTQVSGNTYGLAAGGGGTEILARNTSVFGNTTGLHTAKGGTLYSYGNNSVNGNTTNGTFTGTIGLQ